MKWKVTHKLFQFNIEVSSTEDIFQKSSSRKGDIPLKTISHPWKDNFKLTELLALYNFSILNIAVMKSI